MQNNINDVGKTPSESAVHLAQLMLPEHANPLGNVHGGVIMKLADEAGSLAAMRHAGLLAAQVLDFITPHVQADTTTDQLAKLCHD